MTDERPAGGRLAELERDLGTSGSTSSPMSGMRVALLTPPGRLPTVVYDPGAWWSELVRLGVEPRRLDLNVAWWLALCGAGGVNLARSGWRNRVPRLGRAARVSPAAATRSLLGLRDRASYASADRFIAAVTPFARYLSQLNAAQAELLLHVDFGARVVGLDYGDSRALVAYARRRSRLAGLIEAALDRVEEPVDVAIVTVSRPEELLTALVAVTLLKRRQPGVHACLADHSHENFTLATHLDQLRASGALEAVFDTIVEQRDDRDVVVPDVVRRIAAGEAPAGYVTRRPGSELAATPVAAMAPPTQTFCSEPILWTRLSPRRCYWDKCTFCALNAKFADRRAPPVEAVPEALDRLAAAASLGYRTISFGDEALSPTIVERLAHGILERNLDIRWACCCKLETAFTPALFRLMRAAGCYEVFWGLESISPRVLRLMRKEVPGLDRAGIGRLLRDADRAGLGVHLSLIAGFPGDTPNEVMDSVEFVVDTLRDLSNATFNLNRFMLLDGSPIMTDPESFGVIPRPATGDMPFRLGFDLVPDLAESAGRIDQALPWLQQHLREALGWSRFGSDVGARMAIDLHFFFGQGSIFKQAGGHRFTNPLRNEAAAA